MRSRIRSVAVAALAFVFYSCAENSVTGPEFDTVHARTSVIAPPAVVISQIYGGGGNSGATYKNDFIELFNPGAVAVNLAGWSVQYASAAGAFTFVTALSGSIQAGGYYLIQQAAGTGGTLNLPTPQVIGTIAMGGGSGKVLVAQTTTAFGIACPTGATVIDLASYGSSTNCGNSTPAPSNTTAALRKDGGCTYTANPSTDFEVLAPAPRNNTSPTRNCGTPPSVVAVDRVQVNPPSASILVSATQAFSASAFDASNNPVSGTTFTWSSSNPAVATVNASGVATGIAEGDANIIATAPNGKFGIGALHVAGVAVEPTGPVVVSEIHYDNVSTDANESIEIEGPAGYSLSGWQLVLYNGTGGVTYTTTNLTQTIPATCGARGVVVVSYPSNGIQNGSPDGWALVKFNGAVTEFKSYEGTFAATGGPANGTTSSDIGVNEDPDNSVHISQSLQRDPLTGTWYGPATSTFGGCNVAPPPPPKIAINEILADPGRAAGGASFGEWFEVKNYADTAINMNGWTIVSAGQPNHTIASSIVVAPGGYAVLGRSADLTQNGGVTVNYSYFTGSNTMFLDGTDYLVLRDITGARVDSVRWTNTGTMTTGTSRAVYDVTVDNANVEGTNWGYSTTPFGDGDLGTPGAANPPLDATPPVRANSITFSGRLTTDPALPVGFEDQLFATEKSGATGATISTTFTWTAETPSIASIDANGVMHALSAGSATFRATAADGTTGTYSLPTIALSPGSSAQYANNTEFGVPTDNSPADDYIVTRPEFTASYSSVRNTPNWVAYNLEASHIAGAVDRCDCFTHDPQLPASFTRINTADYTGSGTFAGYGIDRGHLARSFDRTAAAYDNAQTYLLSNIIPQAAVVNQGNWAQLENFLGAQATTSNKELYIIAGVAGNVGTLKGEGKVVIPAQTWKVAVIMNRNKGLADVRGTGDLQVLAWIAQNTAAGNTDWRSWETTVDAVEALSGYDLLALLPDNIEAVVEGTTRAPVSEPGGPYTAVEGSIVPFKGSASSDPDGDALTYAWAFGDGSTGSGVSAPHAYTDNGNFTAILTVKDPAGASDETDTPVTITNAAPVVDAGPDATINSNQAFSLAGTFSDAGANDSPWNYAITWGDGSTSNGTAGSQGGFSANHTYATAGSYAVTVQVTDKDGGAGSDAAQVLVRSAPTASVNGPFSSVEGDAVAMSGAGSADADGAIASYAWDFGDGSTGTGASVSHTYAQDGVFTVTLVVTDNDGLTGTTTTTAQATNSAPAVAPLGNVVQSSGSYAAAGSFADPGADTWTATVDFGDGSGVAPLPLDGKSFSLAHTFAPGQTYTVTVRVSDDDATSTSTHTVRITAPPVANAGGPYSSSEGSSVSMSGAASSDIDGTVASSSWTFGDGATGTGASVSHTYAAYGDYTVTLTVTDNEGFTGTTTTTVQVANVAASIAAFSGATLLPDETYAATGSFTDPGANNWTATVSYGDGSGTSALALSGKNFSLNHTYTGAGTYTVTVTINDGADVSTQTATVTVQTAVQGVQNAAAIVNQWVAAGKLSNGNGNSLLAKLSAAQNQIANGNITPALNQLNAVLSEINALEAAGKLSTADANTLRTAVNRVIASIS